MSQEPVEFGIATRKGQAIYFSCCALALVWFVVGACFLMEDDPLVPLSLFWGIALVQYFIGRYHRWINSGR